MGLYNYTLTDLLSHHVILIKQKITKFSAAQENCKFMTLLVEALQHRVMDTVVGQATDMVNCIYPLL